MPYDTKTGTWIPWNRGKLVGQKAPLKPQEVWAIRVRLEISEKRRDLALFNLAVDSKLRGCDLVSLRVADVRTGGEIRSRSKVLQSKRATLSSSKSRSRHVIQLQLGAKRQSFDRMTGCSPAERIATDISPRDNTRAWLKTGLQQSDCRAPPTRPIRCAAPKPL